MYTYIIYTHMHMYIYTHTYMLVEVVLGSMVFGLPEGPKVPKEGSTKEYPELVWTFFWVRGVWVGVVFCSMVVGLP